MDPENKQGDLKQVTQETALHYLELRGQSISQKTLNQERQAMQRCLGITLPVVKSELTQVLKSRAYSTMQVDLITNAQSTTYQLATRIATATGLRAHELLTLRRKFEQAPSSHRTWLKTRFFGRTGEIYTVKGKGGLIREVLILESLAEQLEQHRLASPRIIEDRKIHYRQYYAMGGGHYWSNSFSAASKCELGWSHGAHGLRHSYAQTRMDELQQQGFLYHEALEIVSQEMGHFRSSITEVYLR